MKEAPTGHQQSVLARLGLPVPSTRADAKKLIDLAERAQRLSAEKDTLVLCLSESRQQVTDLRKLVRYQRLHIARLQAGEDLPAASSELAPTEPGAPGRSGHVAGEAGANTPSLTHEP